MYLWALTGTIGSLIIILDMIQSLEIDSYVVKRLRLSYFLITGLVAVNFFLAVFLYIFYSHYENILEYEFPDWLEAVLVGLGYLSLTQFGIPVKLAGNREKTIGPATLYAYTRNVVYREINREVIAAKNSLATRLAVTENMKFLAEQALLIIRNNPQFGVEDKELTRVWLYRLLQEYKYQGSDDDKRLNKLILANFVLCQKLPPEVLGARKERRQS